MADPFIAEIRIFAFDFPPRGWASCDGQVLPIAQNTALFSLIGTYYGGDGKTTFALPDLRGRAVMHAGQGPGLTARDLGTRGGSKTVALQTTEIPSHTHAVMASPDTATAKAPDTSLALAESAGVRAYGAAGSLVQLSQNAVKAAGSGAPHNNMQPYLTMGFNIALQGVFPPRT